MAVVGYIRVSSFDQNPSRQLDGLAMDKVFMDQVSGRNIHRTELENLKQFVRDGDLVVVHIKLLMADLKRVYQAVTEEEALSNLLAFKDTWGKQYPSCVKSWEENWDILSTFYAYPPEIRKIIYTTNIIEGLNRQFRKITKNKPSFTNDDSLRKILYLASKNIVEHWTARCRNWDQVISQLEILFGDRQAG